VGYSNNDCYVVVDCRLYESFTDDACENNIGYEYVALIRNKALFSDEVLHTFPIVNKALIASKYSTTYNYYAILRPWYIVNDGWTDPY
jgi:hypothetical protein